jgi:glucose-1-phosphate cytidylyltransferase
MKTVILCGGRGTRLGEHGASVPKALIKIGGRPVIWHLLKIYSAYNLNDFVLCLGFLGNEIKRYFLEEQWLAEDFTLENGKRLPHFSENSSTENWRITFAETGLDTNTGGRIKKIEKYLEGEENFCVTYGDGLSDADLQKLIEFHKSHGKIATLTAVHPHSNFGLLEINDENLITKFQEKPLLREWINGGFFVFNRKIFDYLTEDSVLEREPFERLAGENQLAAFQHTGFWKCMDTYKDNVEFNALWDEGNPAWKVW